MKVNTLRMASALAAVVLIPSLARCDNLYVSNYSNNGGVTTIAPGGSSSSFYAPLNDPLGVAFDSSGNLYVALQNSDAIDKITPTGNLTTYATGLTGPVSGLAFNNSGDLFAAIEGSPALDNSGIDEITPNGNVSLFATGFGNALSLAFDSKGTLYVADFGADSVDKVSNNGAVTPFATGLDSPDGLAVDRAGNVYFSTETLNSNTSKIISRISPSGSVTTFATITPSTLVGLEGLAFDNEGNLYAANIFGSIYSITPGGSVNTYASGLNDPVYIADPSFSPFVTPLPGAAGMAALGMAAIYLLGVRAKARAS
jgi:streptogramin lyase